MKIKETLKELWFQWTHTPNSSKGLRHRANILVKKGYSQRNSIVIMLRKQADLKEKKQ